jgi:RNA polymerase sigma-70 factor (ECF subfamily)
MENDERRLVERACNGDLAAFRELVERHQQRVYFLALDLTGNHHDAEDVSQEVFIKAYQSLHAFRGDAKLSSWLYRIAVNACINKRRKKSLSVMSLQENFDDSTAVDVPFSVGDNPERSAESSLMQVHIERALRRLPARQRAVFVLRHYHDLPLKEIAHILKISEGTVKSLLFRGIRRLQKELAFYRRDLGLEESP